MQLADSRGKLRRAAKRRCAWTAAASYAGASGRAFPWLVWLAAPFALHLPCAAAMRTLVHASAAQRKAVTEYAQQGRHQEQQQQQQQDLNRQPSLQRALASQPHRTLRYRGRPSNSNSLGATNETSLSSGPFTAVETPSALKRSSLVSLQHKGVRASVATAGRQTAATKNREGGINETLENVFENSVERTVEDAMLVLLGPNAVQGRQCFLNEHHINLGCHVKCRCALWQQCYPHNVIMRDMANHTMETALSFDVGACHISMFFMGLLSLFLIFFLISLVVLGRMALQWHEERTFQKENMAILSNGRPGGEDTARQVGAAVAGASSSSSSVPSPPATSEPLSAPPGTRQG